MQKRFITVAVGTLAAVVASAFAAGPRPEQIKVEASRIAVTQGGYTYSGVPIRKFSLSYEVNLDDLDLNSKAGVTAAEERVNNAAAAACKEISREYPSSQPANEKCTKTAAYEAMVKLHQAIAATGKTPTK
jgi:UrcA family protein